MSDPLTDERFEDLVAELRDARIATPPKLTGLVEDLAERPQPPGPRPSLVNRLPRLRRPVPTGALAGIAVALFAVGVVVALVVASGPGPSSASSSAADHAIGMRSGPAPPAAVADSGPAASSVERAPATAHLAPYGTATSGAAALPAGATDFQSPQRLQHENVQLRVALANVASVSDATTTVTRAVQGYGGYVVTLGFDATATGQSTIVAKVPFARVQEAIARFAGLGSVVAEHVDLTDLQRQYDTTEQQLARADLQIARTRARLTDTSLAPAAAAALRVRLATAVLQRANLRRAAQQVTQSAGMADLALDLVSRQHVTKPKPVPAKGGAGGAAEAAVDVLAAVAKGAIFVAIVAAPLLVVALAILAGRRWLRVRRQRRLLEQA